MPLGLRRHGPACSSHTEPISPLPGHHTWPEHFTHTMQVTAVECCCAGKSSTSLGCAYAPPGASAMQGSPTPHTASLPSSFAIPAAPLTCLGHTHALPGANVTGGNPLPCASTWRSPLLCSPMLPCALPPPGHYAWPVLLTICSGATLNSPGTHLCAPSSQGEAGEAAPLSLHPSGLLLNCCFRLGTLPSLRQHLPLVLQHPHPLALLPWECNDCCLCS